MLFIVIDYHHRIARLWSIAVFKCVCILSDDVFV